MSNHWDEFSKSLAQPLPRRESLRRLAVALAGAVISPLGLRDAAAGHHPKQQADACKTFCKCRNHKQQDQCLKACNACGKNTSRLGGSCGNYFCCAAAQTSCGNYCADLGNDPSNCGACGYVCNEPGPYEYGACINGRCEYSCVEGAVDCGGYCTILAADVYNCGACGNVCGGPNPSCYQGACSQCTGYCPEGWCGGDGCGGACACPSGMYCESDGWCYADCPSGQSLCGGQCVDTQFDANNCGGCGNVCPEGEACSGGWCCNPDCTPDHPYYPNCGTVCGNPCPFPFILCGGACVDPTSDPFNCGGCFNQCAPSEACVGGFCESGGG